MESGQIIEELRKIFPQFPNSTHWNKYDHDRYYFNKAENNVDFTLEIPNRKEIINIHLSRIRTLDINTQKVNEISYYSFSNQIELIEHHLLYFHYEANGEKFYKLKLLK